MGGRNLSNWAITAAFKGLHWQKSRIGRRICDAGILSCILPTRTACTLITILKTGMTLFKTHTAQTQEVFLSSGKLQNFFQWRSSSTIQTTAAIRMFTCMNECLNPTEPESEVPECWFTCTLKFQNTSRKSKQKAERSIVRLQLWHSGTCALWVSNLLKL